MFLLDEFKNFTDKNSNNSATHQICFIGQNADAFVGWGSGPPPIAEGKLLMEILLKEEK